MNQTRATAPIVLAIALLLGGAIAMTQRDSPEPDAVTPTTKSSSSDGAVVFKVRWTPRGYPQAITLQNEIVNGVNYRPQPTHPDQDLVKFTDFWVSPPRPNNRPAEQVEAELTITFARPQGINGRLWIGCFIEIGGQPAPGYQALRGKGTSQRFDLELTYVCRLPPR